MIEQRVFQFIINGQFWKEIEVNEEAIKKGIVVIPVMTKITAYLKEIAYPNTMAKMKQVRFQLADIIEAKGNYSARCFSGFWAVDDDVYMEDGKLYLID